MTEKEKITGKIQKWNTEKNKMGRPIVGRAV